MSKTGKYRPLEGLREVGRPCNDSCLIANSDATDANRPELLPRVGVASYVPGQGGRLQ